PPRSKRPSPGPSSRGFARVISPRPARRRSERRRWETRFWRTCSQSSAHCPLPRACAILMRESDHIMRTDLSVTRSTRPFPAVGQWGPAVAALVFGLGVACAGAQTPDPNEVHESGGHRFRLVTVADGLQNPWSIAFLPDGDVLVTERGHNEGGPAQLRVIRNGALVAEPVSGLPAIRVGNQGGLLDVVPHPDFATNRLLYISYSKPSADGATGTTAIIRGRFEGTALTDVEEIFEADAWSKGMGHYGSRIAFDADGYLFFTVGDRQAPPSGNL